MDSAITFLSRFIRFFSTLLAYILFGLVGASFALVMPIILRRYSNELTGQLRARRLVSKVWSFYLQYMRISGIYTVEWHGKERLGQKGQLILANHPSLLDILFMISAVPEANCVVKAKLLHNPSMRPAIDACGFIPNDESLGLIEKTVAVLEEGQTLIIFPEGTRTGYDGKICLHRGAVSIGLRGAKIITPVVIKMRPLGLKKKDHWFFIPKKRYHYTITVGKDIDPQEYLSKKPLPIASRILNNDLTHYFQKES